ncbi:ATP synthase F1 subunit delta [Parvibacter caecicola]|uniref:ATP synthase subunit delta n=1 Tax=Parvibacter caecicola TaxID=747645 RepID=A0A4T9TCN7_9ACTN|nr:ATP synthase F1 subunit delta [Parvibacter caecicola]TJW09817.1 ATP synthase F1 subunit delta [Parvibacter caecicola]
MPTNRLVEEGQVETYGSVLFDAALATGGQDEVLEVRDQMEQILSILRSDMDLAMALANPDYTPEQRKTLAEGVFAGCVEPLRVVLAVMAERGNAPLLKRVYEAYNNQLESQLGICVVDVTTVVPLDDNLRHIISTKAEADLGKKVVLREHIDKSILGGIIMSTNGKRIDASMKTQLANARNVLCDTSDGGEC